MRTFLYIILAVLTGAAVYNLAAMNYHAGILSKVNQPYIIGLGSTVCAFILSLILLKYQSLKSDSKK